MKNEHQHWRTSRRIVERIVIEGEMELLTPAHFGSGDAEGAADLTLLRDAYDGSALLPGASIAGALRNYWRERKRGYGARASDSDLFGARRGAKGEMEGSQSLLIVEDAIGCQPKIKLRTGVKIDPATRTAEDEKLFEMELLQAGTKFPLRFELLIDEQRPNQESQPNEEQPTVAEREARHRRRREQLRSDLVLALQGFEGDEGRGGEITLGARKRRGLGKCRVNGWRVRRYDLTTADGLLAWLAEGRDWSDAYAPEQPQGATLAEKMGVAVPKTDQRRRFELEATFALNGSLMVRSGFGEADRGPDAEHLHRAQPARDDPEGIERVPVLPGTSLAGALRARFAHFEHSHWRPSPLSPARR